MVGRGHAAVRPSGGGDADPSGRPAHPASPRAAAAYLVALRPVLADATAGRRALVRSLRGLGDDVRRGGPMVAARAGAIGVERIRTFRALRDRLDGAAAPPSCGACRLTLGRWFDRLIDCCEVLRSVGTTGEAGRLGRAESLLAEAGEYARGFNAEHAALVGELRELVDAAAERARLPVR